MAAQVAVSASLAAQLEKDGIVILANFVAPDQLRDLQRAFALRLKRLRWNDFEGYDKTERHRHMVQNVLTLDQGFVDVALHPVVKETLNEYLGPSYQLVEAKGWLSLPTTEDFHGWHADAWYDQARVRELQREVKLALYLTDVRSGAFTYVKGTHGKTHPRMYGEDEVQRLDPSSIVSVHGQAGTAILFDTTGIHRQAVPILEPRMAVFYGYHDARLPLQPEDVAYNRYHPLLLNAAFLGQLSEEDRRILGFGDKTNYQPTFERAPRHLTFQAAMSRVFDAKLLLDDLGARVAARLRRARRRA